MNHGQFQVPSIEVSGPRLKTWMMTTNRIDKIHVCQQLLSTSSVMDYASRSLGRIEVIHIFHKSGNLGFQFGGKSPTGACDLGIRIHVKAWRKWITGYVVVEHTSALSSESVRIVF